MSDYLTDCLVDEEGGLINCHKQEIYTYLKDSNSYGNIYFARYFEWQGVCREQWFASHIFPNMFELEGAFVTKVARNEYVKEVMPFQRIKCLLNTQNIRKTSFEMVFRFYDADSDELVSKGMQKVGYVDVKTKKPIRLPDDILEKVTGFEL